MSIPEIFTNRTIVITGASEGIGAALAKSLASPKINLALGARNLQKLQQVASACRAAGAHVLEVEVDVSHAWQCERLCKSAIAHFGGIDILVNNAEISMNTRFDEITSLDLIDTVMRVNFLGMVNCTHYALPYLKLSRGLIVAISSIQGKTGFPYSSGYAASKHAVQGFFESLRIELIAEQVSVLLVSPGPVSTGIGSRVWNSAGGPETLDTDRDAQMAVEKCAALICSAIAKRQRELIMTTSGRLLLILKPFFPRWIDAIIAQQVKRLPH